MGGATTCQSLPVKINAHHAWSHQMILSCIWGRKKLLANDPGIIHRISNGNNSSSSNLNGVSNANNTNSRCKVTNALGI